MTSGPGIVNAEHSGAVQEGLTPPPLRAGLLPSPPDREFVHEMEQDLSRLLDGRKVDMHTLTGLSKYFRDDVINEAEEQYVQA